MQLVKTDGKKPRLWCNKYSISHKHFYHKSQPAIKLFRTHSVFPSSRFSTLLFCSHSHSHSHCVQAKCGVFVHAFHFIMLYPVYRVVVCILKQQKHIRCSSILHDHAANSTEHWNFPRTSWQAMTMLLLFWLSSLAHAKDLCFFSSLKAYYYFMNYNRSINQLKPQTLDDKF